MSLIIDRAQGQYVLAVGGANLANEDKTISLLILGLMSFTVIVLLFVIFKMIQIRERRLKADQWLAENQGKLINYALTSNPEETENIAQVLEQSKIQAEVTTGKSNIR